jgi:predicted CoA-substrate-specific enzyme activase
MITYVCKYTPVELFSACGAEFEVPNTEVSDFSYAETLLHSSLCSHAKQLLTASRGAQEMVLTSCCDSVRRVCDVISGGKEHPAFCQIIDLPHTDSLCAVAGLKTELFRVLRLYEAYSGHAFSREKFLKAWTENSHEWNDRQHAMAAGRFVALLGARAGDGLISMIRSRLSLPVFDLTCGGFRNLAAPPENAAELSDDGLMEEYASALLSQMPCMRMTEIGNRRVLTENPNLAGIIYNTVKFCDYYEYEYAGLRGSVQVPLLKLETDYTKTTEGQLLTRIEAFAERFPKESASVSSNGSGQTKTLKNEADPLYIGIDSGSTTTNAVAVGKDGKIRAWTVLRTGARAADSAERALREICDDTGREPEDFEAVCATGYGREYISFADMTKTEITCHACGAHFMNPEARTIIDIGGQDSKVICLDGDGSIINFIMNDKCAAGTGRFLEMMAGTLELDLKEMDALSRHWKKDLTISSTCTVFAESEVVSLIAENQDTADIIHGLNKSVASRTYGMVRRAQGRAPFMMTGGVACNPGVAEELRKFLGAPLMITEHPDLTGAVGAALSAAGII